MHAQGIRYRAVVWAAGSVQIPSPAPVRGRRSGLGAGRGHGAAGGTEPRWLRYRGPRSIAGGSGCGNTGTPGMEVPPPGQLRGAPPVPGPSIVSCWPRPLSDVTGGVTLGRSLRAARALPTHPTGKGWDGPALPQPRRCPRSAPTSPPLWGSRGCGCSKGSHSRRERASQRDAFLQGTQFPPPQHLVC